MGKLKITQKEYKKTKSFIDQYNWKEIDFPSHRKDWKSLNQIINQLLLVFCMCFIILKK